MILIKDRSILKFVIVFSFLVSITLIVENFVSSENSAKSELVVKKRENSHFNDLFVPVDGDGNQNTARLSSDILDDLSFFQNALQDLYNSAMAGNLKDAYQFIVLIDQCIVALKNQDEDSNAVIILKNGSLQSCKGISSADLLKREDILLKATSRNDIVILQYEVSRLRDRVLFPSSDSIDALKIPDKKNYISLSEKLAGLGSLTGLKSLADLQISGILGGRSSTNYTVLNIIQETDWTQSPSEVASILGGELDHLDEEMKKEVLDEVANFYTLCCWGKSKIL